MSSKKRIQIGALCLFCLALTFILSVFLKQPSHTRDWSPDQAILPSVLVTDSSITISNIRNFSYESPTSWTEAYYDKTVHLSDIVSLDYIVEPFGTFGAAHTFLSFGFKDNTYLSFSVEIRKENGESFSALKGLIRTYEIMYVIADERDVITLRANHRKNPVYLYPVDASAENIQKLFLDMVSRVNEIEQYPEFYNTITNNCIINIAQHINNISENHVSWNHTLLFPENSDVYAQELGLIAHDIEIEEARTIFRINEKASLYAHDPLFSQRIRE